MSGITAVPLQPTRKGAVVKLWLGVAAAVVIAAGAAWAGTSRTVATQGTPEQYLAWHAKQPNVKSTASGLQYQVLKAGSGPMPTDADVAFVTYRGTLRDGSVFDESPRPVPFPVTQVVPGFSEGLKLMQKGGTYRLFIPPALGYGAQAAGDIPASSVLIFEVKLVDVQSIAALQAQMQAMQGGEGQTPQR